ncbi:RNA-binding domain-containing protein [Thermococcus sp. 2319x1]|uniref:RNA-binding domain-containing protein n=1 Tax=Thermococcus sp. 2319x1 TaxID=1674923 RepID=UPI0015823AFB|nr:RNA-binding domain-containing protein [Thermococcus sp. 2319x1]
MSEVFEEVEVEAYVYPTEDIEKVKKAMLNLVSPLEFEAFDKGDYILLVGKTRDKKALQRLYELFRGQQILDTARAMLEEGYFGEEIIIKVHKQVAYVGKVNFNEESPLGPITIIIRTKDPQRLMKWLAPRTKDGVPIE